MSKVISVLVFAVVLVWSWNKVHTAQPVSFETHTGIQIRLAELIRETLTQKFPDAEDIRITRLWTEALSGDEIKAVFAYSFQQSLSDGESVKQAVEGEAFLKRMGEGSDEWSLERVKTGANEMEFTAGTVVTPLSDGADTISAPTENPTTPAPETKPKDAKAPVEKTGTETH